MVRIPTAVVLVLAAPAFGPATASAQVFTKGRVIVDRPKSTALGTNCKVVNVRVVQADGTAIMQPRRVCQ
jgi:hypothetical protein